MKRFRRVRRGGDTVRIYYYYYYRDARAHTHIEKIETKMITKTGSRMCFYVFRRPVTVFRTVFGESAKAFVVLRMLYYVERGAENTTGTVDQRRGARGES